jgi:hypothetical protein
MIPLYVIDIARQHAAAHPGHRGGIPLRRMAFAVVVAASCTVLATAAAFILALR